MDANHPSRSRLRRFCGRVLHLLFSLLVAAPIAAGTTISAYADPVAATYPGGCVLSSETYLQPHSCTFTNLGSDPESLIFEGEGFVFITLASAPSPSCPTYYRKYVPPGGTVDYDEHAGCAYTLSFVEGSGLAAIWDGQVSHLGECAATGAWSCDFVAINSSGVAVVSLYGTALPTSSIRVDIFDLTGYIPGDPPIASCSSTALQPTVVCPFTEETGHDYRVTLTVTSGFGLWLMVGAG